MAQTTRTRARKDVPFGIFSHGYPFRGSKPLKHLNFGAWVGVLKPNSQNRKVHIIKTTASISIKIYTVIKTTKCLSWVVPIHVSQIQHGGRPSSWKIEKIVISRQRFHQSPWNLARWRRSPLLMRPTVKNSKFLKSKMAAAILKNRKLTYIRHGFSDYDKIWPFWPLNI